MKQALIITGWYQKTTDNWYLWLKKELEIRGYTVFLPELPTMHTDCIDMSEQMQYIEEILHFDSNTIVIGHSIGAVLGLRLAERHPFKSLILVSGWDFNDLTYEHRLFWNNSIDHTAIQRNVSSITCISSDNDPYFTAFTTMEMAKRLHGTSQIIKGKGHFLKSDGVTEIPEILSLV